MSSDHLHIYFTSAGNDLLVLFGRQLKALSPLILLIDYYLLIEEANLTAFILGATLVLLPASQLDVPLYLIMSSANNDNFVLSSNIHTASFHFLAECAGQCVRKKGRQWWQQQESWSCSWWELGLSLMLHR